MNTKSRRNYDLSKLLKPYENRWVALSYDRRKVLGSADTLDEAREKVEKTERKIVFIKLPPYGVNYVPATI